MPAVRTDWKALVNAAAAGDFYAIGQALSALLNITGDVTPGTVTASKALVVDANKKLDILTVTNMKWPVTTASSSVTLAQGATSIIGSSIAVSYTLAAPSAGAEVILANSAGSTFVTTVTLVSGSFQSSNASVAVAKFDDPSDLLHLVGASSSRWLIVSNVGSVAISS